MHPVAGPTVESVIVYGLYRPPNSFITVPSIWLFFTVTFGALIKRWPGMCLLSITAPPLYTADASLSRLSARVLSTVPAGTPVHRGVGYLGNAQRPREYS